ncbi:MAG: heat-shock protein Hsp90 [Schwartzia sp.]|nr:heat-shock protein Hsp90 [Schwartzia sp. (in: firmicutes)]
MTKTDIIEKVKDLIAAPSCYAPLKALAEEWLKAVDTADEKEMSKKLVAELEKDVQKAADCLAFFDSEAGRKAVGEEFATKMAMHFKELVAAGEVWCDCPACKAGRAILDNKELIL